jgi:hypothetical protein
MRTTLNLDDDVAAQLAERSRRERRSLSRVANDALRAGLREDRDTRPRVRYEPRVFDSGEHLIDVRDVAEALEALERAG